MPDQPPNSPEPEPGAEPVVQTAAGGRPRVLVVAESDDNRKMLAGLCRLFDCDPVTVRSGVDAIEAFAGAPFDIVLMSIRLPGMNGMEATRAIRDFGGAGARVPILAVTADFTPASARAYLAAGMSGVVPEPLKATRLLEAIASALRSEPARPDEPRH